MRKPNELKDDDHDLEIIKAVAQAWHSHSSGSSSKATSNEFDAHRRNFRRKPTRFKLEAMLSSPASATDDNCSGTSSSSGWDFGQSLLDSYEIVSLSKKLETGLFSDHPFWAFDIAPSSRSGKTEPKESKNSLRNLFNKMSARSFNVDDLPWENNGQS